MTRFGGVLAIVSALAGIISTSLGEPVSRWQGIFWPAIVIAWATLAMFWERESR